MKYKYLISKLAAQDIEQSFWWYAERSKQAADNFTLEVQDTIGKICTNPTIGKNK